MQEARTNTNSAERPGPGVIDVHTECPFEIARFRRLSRQASSMRDLARRVGMREESTRRLASRLELPIATNYEIMQMAQEGHDDDGADLMDRIEGKSDRSHLLPNRDQCKVDMIISLAEAFYGVPTGTVAGSCRKKQSRMARHGAIKVAALHMPGVTKVRMGQLFGGLHDGSIAHALRKPDVPFRDFIDHTQQVLA